eukprot:CAMPEP_0115160746 /NCGR_PEP_ID=MMETSP0227-20121206/70981_1 /TAXON_ID=89957 /ORGANISM="Polarella glacialis, Strain CCMP 1383" /LENGTH=516 /DNA_ID=CAMNT_0002572687 /DNA_START=158 /DNA_END=1708 /DNA_ORIENTATION=+
MIGSKAWEFAMPLLLVGLSGGRLIAPAVLGIATTSAEVLLGPVVGRWNDREASRFYVVCVGAGTQAVAVLATLAMLLLAQALECDGNISGLSDDPAWFAGSRPTLGGAVFLSICVCGIFEVTGRMASSVSVQRDWVPTAFEAEGEEVLTRVNAKMANIDLLGEILGPLIAGFVFAVAPTPVAGFAAIGIFNGLSFGPQLWLLAAARARSPALQALRSAEAKDESEPAAAAASEDSAWRIFFTHPSGVPLISLSYVMVFFTVLSSHDVVLTAYLSQVGLHPMVLSSFRALGAAAGVLGATSFDLMAEAHGMRKVTGSFLTMQAGTCLIAALALGSQQGVPGRAPAWLGGTPWYLLPFLGAIVISRVGLYGFDVGFSTLSQGLVDERHRGTVGGVTQSLCALATLCMYVTTSAVTTIFGTAGFEMLVWASTAAVAIALLTYWTWCMLYHEHEHIHGSEGNVYAIEDDSGHGHSHGSTGQSKHDHVHTAQQEKSLKADGQGWRKHRHVHYHGPLWMAGG